MPPDARERRPTGERAPSGISLAGKNRTNLHRAADRNDHLESFGARVIQDALSEATASYWRRRAAVFETARPKVGDFPGWAARADLRARDERLATTALACRQRAAVALYGEQVPDV